MSYRSLGGCCYGYIRLLRPRPETQCWLADPPQANFQILEIFSIFPFFLMKVDSTCGFCAKFRRNISFGKFPRRNEFCEPPRVKIYDIDPVFLFVSFFPPTKPPTPQSPFHISPFSLCSVPSLRISCVQQNRHLRACFFCMIHDTTHRRGH